MAETEDTTRPQGRSLVIRAGRKVDSPHVKALKAFSDKKQFTDPFGDLYVNVGFNNTFIALKPPYNFNSLIKLPKENSYLLSCINAMVTNVAGHGYSLAYIGPDGKEESKEAKAEAIKLKSFLDFPNESKSLIESLLMEKTDKETIGNGYLEVGRDEDGQVAMVAHIPGHTIRRTVSDRDFTTYTVRLMRDGKPVNITMRKRFCRYIQIVNGNQIFFKEFGDPRQISVLTGEVKTGLKPEEQANEIIVDAYYNPGDAYGLPQWIGQLPSILGSRESEMSNLDFFKENTIPALVVMVSGGAVTQASIDHIEQTLTAARGRDNQNRIVVIETAPDPRMASAEGAMQAPKLDIKPLVGERQNEGLFLDYDKSAGDKIRSAFRLPPIFVGATGDYTFATAKTAFEVAESQVFGPERRATDDMVNNLILAGFKPEYWAFRLQPARISDPEEVTNALAVFDGMGAMTPNTAIQMANQYFDLNIPKIQEEWGNWPFAIVQAYANAGRLKGVDGIAEAANPADNPALDTQGGTSNDPSQVNQPNGIKSLMLLRREVLNLKKVMAHAA